MSHVETEIGTVLEVQPGRARVEVSPSGLCAHCEMSATCLPSTSGNRVIEVADGLGVSVGQRVEIELESTTLLLASFLAYLVPVLLLLAGALIGFYGAGGASTELWSGIGALCGFITGLLTSRALGKALEKRGKLTPVIVATVENEGKEE